LFSEHVRRIVHISLNHSQTTLTYILSLSPSLHTSTREMREERGKVPSPKKERRRRRRIKGHG
jgi:hypothetical protein